MSSWRKTVEPWASRWLRAVELVRGYGLRSGSQIARALDLAALDDVEGLLTDLVRAGEIVPVQVDSSVAELNFFFFDKSWQEVRYPPVDAWLGDEFFDRDELPDAACPLPPTPIRWAYEIPRDPRTACDGATSDEEASAEECLAREE